MMLAKDLMPAVGRSAAGCRPGPCTLRPVLGPGSASSRLAQTRVQLAQGRHRPSWMAPSSSAAMGDVPAVGASSTHWLDSLPETQRYVLADEWGFDLLGVQLPEGIDPAVLLRALPEEVEQHSTKRALLGLAAPLALMAAGYGWMWYMHSITPLWQQLLCWLAVGTGYVGLFQVAHECGRNAFLPNNPVTQGILGALLMAPSLFSYETWRVRTFAHLLQVNALGQDTNAWHPLTVEELARADPHRRSLLRLAATTPLKLLSPIADLVRSMQGWDLRTFYDGLRPDVLRGWAVSAAFLGLALPAMAALGGLQGVFNWWFMPWLVFNAWLGVLTLAQHTAPHIPWRQPGKGYDVSQSIISGTVTLRMPGWLEWLFNYANYHVPQHLSPRGVPYYHAKAATEALRTRLWPYMSEARLGVKMLINHITKWQVYDTEREAYITFDEAMAMIQEREGAAAGGDAGPEAAAGSTAGPATAPIMG